VLQTSCWVVDFDLECQINFETRLFGEIKCWFVISAK
jgi:hypothetical protein